MCLFAHLRTSKDHFMDHNMDSNLNPFRSLMSSIHIIDDLPSNLRPFADPNKLSE